MAEHTKIHLWINTIVAAAAMGLSGLSTFVSYRTANLKTELLGFTSQSTFNCPLQETSFGTRHYLGFCWLVTIANQADIKTTIISYKTEYISANGKSEDASVAAQIVDEHGAPVQLPIALDGGDARALTFSVPIEVGAGITQLAQQLKETSPGNLTLFKLAAAAVRAKMDLVGNKYEKFDFSKPPSEWPAIDTKPVLASIKVLTGRQMSFSTQLSYYPGIHYVTNKMFFILPDLNLNPLTIEKLPDFIK